MVPDLLIINLLVLPVWVLYATHFNSLDSEKLVRVHVCTVMKNDSEVQSHLICSALRIKKAIIEDKLIKPTLISVMQIKA